MVNKTENYSLKKPTEDEFYDVEIQNGNMDTIDSVLKGQADAFDDYKEKTDEKIKNLSEQDFEVSADNFTGVLPISKGGTDGKTADEAVKNLLYKGEINSSNLVKCQEILKTGIYTVSLDNQTTADEYDFPYYRGTLLVFGDNVLEAAPGIQQVFYSWYYREVYHRMVVVDSTGVSTLVINWARTYTDKFETAKIETGSYTGVVGAEDVTLTFSFTPKIVFIHGASDINKYPSPLGFFIKPATRAPFVSIYYQAAYPAGVDLIWEDNALTLNAFNSNNVTYYYVAIG